MHPSQANAQDLESQRGPRIIGLKIFIDTPSIATKPGPSLFSFIFFSFIYFV